MKNFINYIKESKEEDDLYENAFLELAHLNELVIKFDFIVYDKNIYYFYKETVLFIQRHAYMEKKRYMEINYIDIWSILAKITNNFTNFTTNTAKIVETHFKSQLYIETFSVREKLH